MQELMSKPSFQNWDVEEFPWSNAVREKLNELGMRDFKEHQLGAINAAMDGNDVYLCLATGGGKSLTFFLPASLQSGLTIVVVPLIALMRNLHNSVKDKIPSLLISSDDRNSQDIAFSIIKDRSRDIRLLFISPERLANAEFVTFISNLHEKKRLRRFVFDEAHCISSMGHDYREDYKKVGEFTGRFSSVPITAVTATATKAVSLDIKNILALGRSKKLVQYTSSCNRPNIYYSVFSKDTMQGVVNNIMQRLKTVNFIGNSGIVYCCFIDDCKALAQMLNLEFDRAYRDHVNKSRKELVDRPGYRFAAAYYAKMADRRGVEDDWMSGNVSVICATAAFGMGIDKKDVRFVYHLVVPQSVEAYVQESGRGGRDGKFADAGIFYSTSDRTRVEGWLRRNQTEQVFKKKTDADKQEANIRNFDKMRSFNKIANYCEERAGCRRERLLENMDEQTTDLVCNKYCDNCRYHGAKPLNQLKIDQMLPTVQTHLSNSNNNNNNNNIGSTEKPDKEEKNRQEIMKIIKSVAKKSAAGHDIRKFYGLEKFK